MYKIINPENGVKITRKIGDVVYELEVGESYEFDNRIAAELVLAYGFLVIEPSKKLGAIGEDNTVLLAKLKEQEDTKAEAEAAKLCSSCGQLLPEFVLGKKRRGRRASSNMVHPAEMHMKSMMKKHKMGKKK